MHVELTTNDLLNLVHSTPPSYNLQMEDEQIIGLGRWSSAFNRWIWNHGLKDLDDEALFNLYIKCRDTK